LLRSKTFLALACLCLLSPCFAASVTLAWNPSTDATAAGYHVYFWDAGTQSSNLLFAAGMVTVGTVTNATVTNLVAGSTYTFAVTTMDADGVESLLSNEVTYQIPTNVVTGPVTLAIAPLTWATNLFNPPLVSTNRRTGRLNTNYFYLTLATLLLKTTNEVSGAWSLLASSNLATWQTNLTGTNGTLNVILTNQGGKAFYRLKMTR
jgi:hypothetical protein